MLGKLLLTTAVVLAAIHSTSAQGLPECTRWTKWLDQDDPGGANGGDIETYLLRACLMPTMWERRVVGPIPAGHDRVQFFFFEVGRGFVCRDEDQTPETECLDYEVRFCCPLPDCPNWSDWYNAGDPNGGTGDDYELLQAIRPPNCPRASYVQARTANEPHVDALQTDDQVQIYYDRTVGPEIVGLECFERDQQGENDEECEDYEVRFCCSALDPYCSDGTVPDPLTHCQTDADCDPNYHCLHSLHWGWRSICCPGRRREIATTSEPTTESPGQTTTPGPTPEPPCSIDIVIVIDVSSSMPDSEFLRILQLLIEFIQCFNGTDVQIGIITYECLPYLDIRLGTFPLGDPGLTDAINGLEHRGGNSRTGLALHYVKCMTDFREDACPVVMVLTDGTEAIGQGTDDYVAQANMLRDSGIELYAVAFGYPFLLNTAALGTITGNPDRVFSSSDPCDLANRIIDECCEEN